MAQELWVEKYRPNCIADYVFRDDRMKRQIEGWIAEKSIPHLLLSGSQGLGKTSLINVLLAEIMVDSGDIMEINASEETSVDVIRSKVLNFASTIPYGDFKVIILEECLEENENIMTPTGNIALKHAPKHGAFPVLSFNMETGEIEDDLAIVISDKNDEVYEVELEDGRIIQCTLNHPFLVQEYDKIVEKKLCELSAGDEIICL